MERPVTTVRRAGPGPLLDGGWDDPAWAEAETIEVAHFRPEGSDLHMDKEIQFTQAALGCTIEVPTLEGTVRSVRVPAGTQSHSRIRLRGHGLTDFQGKGKGDLYVRLIVKVPTKLERHQRDLLEELVKEGI